jgi:hypothetical protein
MAIAPDIFIRREVNGITRLVGITSYHPNGEIHEGELCTLPANETERLQWLGWVYFNSDGSLREFIPKEKFHQFRPKSYPCEACAGDGRFGETTCRECGGHGYY